MKTFKKSQMRLDKTTYCKNKVLVKHTFTKSGIQWMLFILRYGSPHHSRSQSVKAGRSRTGERQLLGLPQQRARVASMPNTGVEEEYYRLRHFSITGNVDFSIFTCKQLLLLAWKMILLCTYLALPQIYLFSINIMFYITAPDC